MTDVEETATKRDLPIDAEANTDEPPKKQTKVEDKVQEESAVDDTKADESPPATEAKAEDAKVNGEVEAKAPAPVADAKPAPTPAPAPKPAAASKPAPAASSLPNGLPPGLPTGNGNPTPVNPNVAASLSNPASIVEERGEVSALYVGRVIGKGGEMIRDLQARSGCRIDVDQKVPPGQPRVITYRGTRRTVDFAKRLVHTLCQENSSEADLPLGEAKREYLVVPAQSVGKIIGRGGEMIRELQSRSSAKIQVDHSGTSGVNQDEKQVTITGTEQSVTKAKEMVLLLVANPMMDAMQAINMLVEEKVHRGGVWGSGPPYPNMPSQGQNMQPNAGPGGGGGYGGGYDQQAPHYGGAPAAAPAYAAPQANPYGAPGGQYAAPVPAYQQQQHHQQQQAPPAAYGQQQGQQQHGGASGGVEMEVFYSAKNFMGRIIGQKGVTINDLQRRSACDIQINQDVPPGQECEISIRGSRQGVEMAKQMLREIIEIGPNHPYAGGNQSGGGGGGAGGGGGGGYQQQPAYGQQAPQAYGGYQQPQQQQQQPAAYGQEYGQQRYQAQAQAYGMQQMGGYQAPQAAAYAQQPDMSYQQPQHGYGQPPAAPAAAAIGWKSATSPSGQIYYYNERTGETKWDKPIGMP